MLKFVTRRAAYTIVVFSLLGCSEQAAMEVGDGTSGDGVYAVGNEGTGGVQTKGNEGGHGRSGDDVGNGALAVE